MDSTNLRDVVFVATCCVLALHATPTLWNWTFVEVPVKSDFEKAPVAGATRYCEQYREKRNGVSRWVLVAQCCLKSLFISPNVSKHFKLIVFLPSKLANSTTLWVAVVAFEVIEIYETFCLDIYASTRTLVTFEALLWSTFIDSTYVPDCSWKI